MRKYIAKIQIPEDLNLSTGAIGELIFEKWFKANFYEETLHKQKADRDFDKIDFADEKGYTYQVKTTKANTYTFNCALDDIRDHLTADMYIFIQIKNNIAYIEPFHDRAYVLQNIKQSYKYDNTFVWIEDLQQEELFI